MVRLDAGSMHRRDRRHARECCALAYSRRQLLVNAVIKRIAVAVATSRAGHRSPKSGREGQHRRRGRGRSQLIPSQ
jgi:hypothetical protein